jgi:signal peptidase I
MPVQPEDLLSERAAMETTRSSTHAARLGLVSEILQEFGNLSLRVNGNSMVPAIFPGEIVTVRRTPAGEVQSGDVILYLRGARFFAHRVVRSTKTSEEIGWITRGDALFEDDPPVFERELLGTVVAIERTGKQIAPQRKRTIAGLLIAWCLRRSGVALAICVRWHRFRNRLASCSFQPEIGMQGQEGNI